MSGSFGVADGAVVCTPTMSVAILAGLFGAAFAAASGALVAAARGAMAVSTAKTGALIYLCLEVGDGGHEGLHLFHHRLVLSGGGDDAGELLLEVVLGDLLGSLVS